MIPFTCIAGIAAPLPIDNIDTDKILPAVFLKRITRKGMGDGLFHTMRHTENGALHPDFILNRAPWSAAQILVTSRNFGCGSSREHAPWALLDFGIRVVIARSFADIFYSNCFKNGILPIVLGDVAIDALLAAAADPATAGMIVDLPAQTVTTPAAGITYSFEIDGQRKADLETGVDDIGRTLGHLQKIEAFERNRSGIWAAMEDISYRD